MSPELARAVTGFRKYLRPEGPTTFSILSRLAPDETERRVMVERVQEIDEWFRPAAKGRIGEYVAQLMVAMPLASDDKQDEEGLEAIAKLYVTALDGLPLFAIKQGCEYALRGKVGETGGRFRPTPGELFLACEREMEFFVRERKQIQEVLNAEVVEPPTPGHRELARKARVMIAEIAAADPPPNEIARGAKRKAVGDGLTLRERAEGRLKELHGHILPQMSAEALAIFKRKDVASE
jgi:hypothetical protein